MVNEEDLTQAILNIGADSQETIERAVAHILENITERNMLPRDAMGIPPDIIEAIYSQAYRHYTAGRYVEGARLFHLLQLLDATEPKYIIGAGACYQMMEEYQNAIVLYSSVTLVDPLTPVPHYHAADCYSKIGIPGAALGELRLAIQLCRDLPEYAAMKQRSELLAQSLEDKIAEAKKEPQK